MIHKIKKPILSASLLFFLGTTAEVFAAGAGSSDPKMDLIYKIVNFLVLVTFLFFVAKKPIANMLSTAAKNKKAEMDSIIREAQLAEEKLKEFKEKIANLEKEIQVMKDNATSNAEQEKNRIIKDANAFVERLKEQAKFQMEQDVLNAKREIQEILTDESIRIAEELITKKLSQKEHQALINDYTKLLKEAK